MKYQSQKVAYAYFIAAMGLFVPIELAGRFGGHDRRVDSIWQFAEDTWHDISRPQAEDAASPRAKRVLQAAVEQGICRLPDFRHYWLREYYGTCR